METLFIYYIKASGLIGLFYFAYFLLLRKETFFSANRWFLLLGLITSSVLPLFFITKIIWVEPTTDSFDWSNIPMTTSVTAPEPKINWYLMVAYAYFIGIAISFLKLVFDFNSLIKLLKSKTMQQQGNFKLIDIAENIAPFSYFNYIVYNSSLYTAVELENILEHEKVHSQQKHSVDVLISRLFCIFFWFNPLIWLYKKAMAQNLEFIADNEAAKKITDKKAYQFTLLKITTQENCVALTNHFYQSLIKKRIIMLNQNQSKKWNLLKYASVIPALIAFVFLFQIEVVAQEKELPKQEKETKTDNIKEALHDIEKNLDTISNSDKNNTSKSDENNVKTPNNTPVQLDDKTNAQTILNQDINNKPLIIIDGIKQDSNFKIEEIPTDQIAKIDVLKGISAITKYGKNGKNGVIEITTKEKTAINNFNPVQKKTVKGFQLLKQEETKTENKDAVIDKIDFIITKNTTDEEIKEKCEQIKNLYNINLSFFNIKRNSNGEITNIESKYKNNANGNNGYFTTTKKPIEPFKFYSEKITLGSTSGHATGYANLSNSISRITNDQQIDYKKAVIVIDGKQSDYQTLEKLSPNDIKQVIKKDINSKSLENKKYYESYGEKALYGFLIEVKTNKYYNQHK